MSNLWFFRLRRAEQQRRRSSGEQSVGSTSVQSAVGLSAASLPAASASSATRQGQMVPPPANMRSHLCDELEPEVDESWQAEVCGAREHSVVSEREYERERERETLGRRHQVPQVTIIRSDSNSSAGLMADNSIAGQWAPPGALAAPRAPPANKRPNRVGQLISRLVDPSGGPVESRLAAGGAGDEPPAQQADGKRAPAKSNQDSAKCANKWHAKAAGQPIHDQLSSGKVPPIHERLLNPAGGAGPNLADSMDNLAALIPR